MMSELIYSHLKSELDLPDPWQLSENPYEQLRYRTVLSLIETHENFEHGLEVGCAAGVFTEYLVKHCKRLTVLDILPEAIRRCNQALGEDKQNVSYIVADIAENLEKHEEYDLIIVCEVLYYLVSDEAIQLAINLLTNYLRPNGILLFGSVIESVTSRWGLPGAESMMLKFEEKLKQQRIRHCKGRLPDEKAVIVEYTKT